MAFHHLQVTVTGLERSRAFYGGFLGLPELKRPEFPFPGAWFALLHAAGFHEDLPGEHPLKIVIKRHPPTGYPQVYFFDPDRRLLEWNAATLD
jgi:catechol 2,3-dioxygenase-like lactoylglutathione lyase family enzyme